VSTFSERSCWAIYRELAHSPGRETDDALILRATAARLEALGYTVELKTAEEVIESNVEPPPYLFVMCERLPILARLEEWEKRGSCMVNRGPAIRNTYRDKTVLLFEKFHVPFPASVMVPTSLPIPPEAEFRESPAGCWVKRGDVHATESQDVVFAANPLALGQALKALLARGIEKALIQEHVAGDLIKYYGVGEVDPQAESETGGGWFQWFYHRGQELKNYRFDERELAAAVSRAATALGLEVFGGDAIATKDGRIIIIDLNAWPSFALYRDVASGHIASYLAERFRRHAEVEVQE